MVEEDGAFSGNPPGMAIDEKSLIQRLYNTNAWKAAGATTLPGSDKVKIVQRAIFNANKAPHTDFETLVRTLEREILTGQTSTHSSWAIKDSNACFQFINSELEQLTVLDPRDPSRWNTLLTAASLLILCLESHPHEHPKENFEEWASFRFAVENGPLTSSSSGWPKNSSAFYGYLECALSKPAMNCARFFFVALGTLNAYDDFFATVYPSHDPVAETAGSAGLSPQYRDSLMEVLSVWAKLVFRENWKQSNALLQSGSPEHHTLVFLERLVKCNVNNPWPFYKDSYGVFPLVAREIDIVKEPPKWWARKTTSDDKIHLLDFDFLFSQRERVVFFRSINFHRMLKSFETAMEANALMVRMYNTYRETTTSSNRREEIFNRLRTTVTQFLVLEANRGRILEDVFHNLWRRERRELLRPLKVKFGADTGEDGLDLGGLQQEFFRLAFAEAMDPKFGMFTTDPVTQMAWFQPLSPTVLYQFALVGMLFGLATYNGITLPVNLPRWFYKWLMGHDKPELDDLEDGWPDVHKNLKVMQDYTGEDFEDVFCINNAYTVDIIGHRVEMDMDKPFPASREEALKLDAAGSADEAVPITHVNKARYLQNRVDWLLVKSVKSQMDAFRTGFRIFFGPRDLGILDAEDLHKMTEGERHIKIEELKRVARYEEGFHEDHQTIRNFWSVVETYDQDKLRKLLEFVTATDRMPVAGMQDLLFVILRNGVPEDDKPWPLPSSHTCFSRLSLPDYEDREMLEKMLGIALNNSEGFGMP